MNSCLNVVWYPYLGITNLDAPNLSTLHALNQSAQGNVIIASGSTIPISRIGCSKVIRCRDKKLHLQDTLYVPTFKNLLSVRKLCNDNHLPIVFDKSFVLFKDRAT